MKNRSLRFVLLRGLALPFLACVTLMVYGLMETTHLVDDYFTNGFSRTILRGLSFMTSRIPVSVAEVFALGILILMVIFLLRFISSLLSKKNILSSFFKVTNLLSLLLLSFLLIWGFNYRQKGLEYSSLALVPAMAPSAKELQSLVNNLTLQAIDERMASGVMDEVPFRYEGDMISSALKAYEELSFYHEEFKDPVGRPKPLASSFLFSHLGISGIFNPLTAEANYNAHQPDLLGPATILHELAHLKGISREGEANFLAYYASRYSEDPGTRYSGTMLALIHSVRAMRALDAPAADEAFLLFSPGMVQDLMEHQKYWQNFQGTFQDLSREVNDSYLKANGQKDGVETYEDMVGYLVNYYKEPEHVNLEQYKHILKYVN